VSGHTKTLLGVRSYKLASINSKVIRGLRKHTRMAKGRSIQDIPRIFWKEIRSNCQILPKEFQITLGVIDTGKNGIMWKVALKWLPKFLGPLDFFVGNCKKILPWVAPYEKNQLGKSCRHRNTL
jgi:hypothetical protein